MGGERVGTPNKKEAPKRKNPVKRASLAAPKRKNPVKKASLAAPKRKNPVEKASLTTTQAAHKVEAIAAAKTMSPRQKLLKIVKVTCAVGAGALAAYYAYLARSKGFGKVLASAANKAETLPEVLKTANAVAANVIPKAVATAPTYLQALFRNSPAAYFEAVRNPNPTSAAPRPVATALTYTNTLLRNAPAAYFEHVRNPAPRCAAVKTHDTTKTVLDKILGNGRFGVAAMLSLALLASQVVTAREFNALPERAKIKPIGAASVAAHMAKYGPPEMPSSSYSYTRNRRSDPEPSGNSLPRQTFSFTPKEPTSSGTVRQTRPPQILPGSDQRVRGGPAPNPTWPWVPREKRYNPTWIMTTMEDGGKLPYNTPWSLNPVLKAAHQANLNKHGLEQRLEPVMPRNRRKKHEEYNYTILNLSPYYQPPPRRKKREEYNENNPAPPKAKSPLLLTWHNNKKTKPAPPKAKSPLLLTWHNNKKTIAENNMPSRAWLMSQNKEGTPPNRTPNSTLNNREASKHVDRQFRNARLSTNTTGHGWDFSPIQLTDRQHRAEQRHVERIRIADPLSHMLGTV